MSRLRSLFALSLASLALPSPRDPEPAPSLGKVSMGGASACMEPPRDPVEAFHAHLDACAQCRDNPFALCSTGAPLLKAAAEGAIDSLGGSLL